MDYATGVSDVEAGSQAAYLCPACMQKYELSSATGLYGLHPANYDDVFIAVLCNKCTYIITAEPDCPDRLALKNRLDEYFCNPVGHPFQGAIALTTLKVLEVYSGDIFMALEIGWPFPKPMHHYHVVSMPGGGIVMVAEKEGDHDR